MFALVILTGNSNERYIDLGSDSAYSYVITVSWSKDHSKAVPWMPLFWERMRDLIAEGLGDKRLLGVDLLGLSRGHVALLACCEYNVAGLHLRLGRQYRYFMAAGGCIWHREGYSSVADNILRGIEEMSKARSSLRIFFFNF